MCSHTHMRMCVCIHIFVFLRQRREKVTAAICIENVVIQSNSNIHTKSATQCSVGFEKTPSIVLKPGSTWWEGYLMFELPLQLHFLGLSNYSLLTFTVLCSHNVSLWDLGGDQRIKREIVISKFLLVKDQCMSNSF